MTHQEIVANLMVDIAIRIAREDEEAKKQQQQQKQKQTD